MTWTDQSRVWIWVFMFKVALDHHHQWRISRKRRDLYVVIVCGHFQEAVIYSDMNDLVDGLYLWSFDVRYK